MAGAVVGGYSANYSLRLPWALGSAALMATAIGGRYLIMDPVRPEVSFVSLGTRIRTRLLSGLLAAQENKTVLMLAFARSIQIAASSPFEMEWQKFFMDSMSIRIGTIGLILCLFRVANHCRFADHRTEWFLRREARVPNRGNFSDGRRLVAYDGARGLPAWSGINTPGDYKHRFWSGRTTGANLGQ